MCTFTVLNNLCHQTTVFSILFLLCLGMIFFNAGNGIIKHAVRVLLVHPVNLFFAGTLIGTVSWVSACNNAVQCIIILTTRKLIAKSLILSVNTLKLQLLAQHMNITKASLIYTDQSDGDMGLL